MNKKITLAGVLLFTLGLSACSKLTMENYQQLKLGMEISEIEGLIGSASDCSATMGTQSCLWGAKDGANIKVNFIAGKAVTFTNDGLE